jgi:hypothetical protein
MIFAFFLNSVQRIFHATKEKSVLDSFPKPEKFLSTLIIHRQFTMQISRPTVFLPKALLPNIQDADGMQKPVLSEIQSKILLALLVRGKVSSLDILQAVGISGSTWNKEKLLLQNTGLIESQVTRELAESGVVRKMEFKLTLKGRQVAQNLLAITSLIGDESFASEKIESVLELIVKA